MGAADVRRPVGVLAVALPPLVMGAATVLVLVLALFGVHPLWPPTAVNASEALSTSDEAAFVRLMLHGADPNARSVVRAGLRENVDVKMTPVEVAVDSQSERALRLALSHGAVVSGERARGAMCIAHRKAKELLPILKEHGAPDVDPQTCPQGLGDQIEMLNSLQ